LGSFARPPLARRAEAGKLDQAGAGARDDRHAARRTDSSAEPPEPQVTDLGYLLQASGGAVPSTPAVAKDALMGEFNKDQGQQSDQQQGEKPAFGQFDKQQGEKGEQGSQEFGQDKQQQEFGQGKQDELAGAGKEAAQQGGAEFGQKSEGDQGSQKGEGGWGGQQEQGQSGKPSQQGEGSDDFEQGGPDQKG
jgi:hypothetical protein